MPAREKISGSGFLDVRSGFLDVRRSEIWMSGLSGSGCRGPWPEKKYLDVGKHPENIQIQKNKNIQFGLLHIQSGLSPPCCVFVIRKGPSVCVIKIHSTEIN